MRARELTPPMKKYLVNIYKQYEEKKLTDREILQFFQDCLDTGFVAQLDEKTQYLAKGLLKKGFLIAPDKKSPEELN